MLTLYLKSKFSEIGAKIKISSDLLKKREHLFI